MNLIKVTEWEYGCNLGRRFTVKIVRFWRKIASIETKEKLNLGTGNK